MNKKGFVFSTDLLFASITILVVFFIVLSLMTIEIEQSREVKNRAELEAKSILFSDLLVKSSDSGVAYFDAEKKRTIENAVSLNRLKSFADFDRENFFVKKIYLKTKAGKTYFIEKNEDGKCLTVERFVIVFETGEKGVLGVEFCER